MASLPARLTWAKSLSLLRLTVPRVVANITSRDSQVELVLGQGHDGGDALALLERQKIDQRLAARLRRRERQPPDLLLVDLSGGREEQHRLMGRGDEQARDEILLARRHRPAPLAAAALRPVGRERRALDVAAVAHQHDHVLALDEVLVIHVGFAVEDLGAARRGEVGFHLDELVADDPHQARARAEDVQIVGDLEGEPVQRFRDLIAPERGQTGEAQFEDGARLRLRQANRAVGVEGVARIGDERDQGRHVARRPGALHQRRPRGGRVGRGADQPDHFVDIGDGDGETNLDMGGVARLGEQELGAAGDDLLAEVEEGAQHVAERQHFRSAAVQRDHVAAEVRLHRGEAPELVEDDLGDRVALELDDDPHAVSVGLVAQVRDPFDALLAHELGDLLDQRRLVDLVGDLADDQRLAVLALAQLFDRDLGAHDDRAAPGCVGRSDAGAAKNRSAGWEVGAWQMLHQFVERDVGLLHHRQQRVDGLAEIVRRDVGRHADGDAARAVDQEVREARRQDDRLLLLLVVVRLEIDRVLVEIFEQRQGGAIEPRLGVAGGRRRVAVDRAEIALPVDQRDPHREILRHPHERIVNGEIAVRMVLAHRVADGAGGLVVGAVRREIQLGHRIEDAAMHRLQAVADVGQGAADDHAHRVIEVAALHFVEDRDRLDVGRALGIGPLVAGVAQRFASVGMSEGLADSDDVRHSRPRPSQLYLCYGNQLSRRSTTRTCRTGLGRSALAARLRGRRPRPGRGRPMTVLTDASLRAPMVVAVARRAGGETEPMTIAIWCILIAATLPYVAFGFVKGLDPNQPRDRVGDLSGRAARAYGAHLNALNLPWFAAAEIFLMFSFFSKRVG